MSHGGVHAVNGQCISNAGPNERKVSNGKTPMFRGMRVSGIILRPPFSENSTNPNGPTRADSAVRDDVTQTSRPRLRECRSAMVGRRPGQDGRVGKIALCN